MPFSLCAIFSSSFSWKNSFCRVIAWCQLSVSNKILQSTEAEHDLLKEELHKTCPLLLHTQTTTLWLQHQLSILVSTSARWWHSTQTLTIVLELRLLFTNPLRIPAKYLFWWALFRMEMLKFDLNQCPWTAIKQSHAHYTREDCRNWGRGQSFCPQ